MIKLLNILLSVTVVWASVRLSDYQFKNSHTNVNWVAGQTLVPETSVPQAESRDVHRHLDKKEQTYEFREENPEVTSDDEETLIEDE